MNQRLRLRLIILLSLLSTVARATTFSTYSSWASAAEASALAAGVPVDQYEVVTENFANDQFNSGIIVTGCNGGLTISPGCGTAPPYTDGSIVNNEWVGFATQYNVTQFSFPTAVYGLGMNIETPDDGDPYTGDGVYLYAGGNPAMVIPADYDGFFGIISSTPMVGFSIGMGPNYVGNYIITQLDFADPPNAADVTPEPASMGLLGIGLFGVGAYRWKKRKEGGRV